MNNCYWTLLEKGNWKLYLAATEAGLCYVGSPGAPFGELAAWAKKKHPHVELERNDARMERYADALAAYVQGERREFDVPLDLKGTAFQLAVWQELLRIQYGETCAYGDIAALLGKASAVRAVASAIGANPVLIVVPCHRVVGKDGSLTGYRGGMEAKAGLLRLEGARHGAVETARGKVRGESTHGQLQAMPGAVRRAAVQSMQQSALEGTTRAVEQEAVQAAVQSAPGAAARGSEKAVFGAQ